MINHNLLQEKITVKTLFTPMLSVKNDDIEQFFCYDLLSTMLKAVLLLPFPLEFYSIEIRGTQQS